MYRKNHCSLSLMSLKVAAIGMVVINLAVRQGSPTQHQTAQASTLTTMVDTTIATHDTTTMPAIAQLEDDASQWGIFYDGGRARATLTNVARPSIDGRSLQVSLLCG